MKCPECGEELESGALFCWSCGHKMAGGPVVRFCPECGGSLENGAKFCVILFAMTVYCFLLTLVNDNGLGIVMAVLQMIGLAILYLAHNKILLKNVKAIWIGLIWALDIAVNIVFIMSFRVI